MCRALVYQGVSTAQFIAKSDVNTGWREDEIVPLAVVWTDAIDRDDNAVDVVDPTSTGIARVIHNVCWTHEMDERKVLLGDVVRRRVRWVSHRVG